MHKFFKRKVLCMLLFIGLITCLSACGKEANARDAPTDTAESSTAAETNEKKDNILEGTYVGKTGSGLTLYDDGTAAYYYDRDVDRAATWVYEKSTITVHLPSLNYDIYANVKEGDTSSLVFKADTPEWLEEVLTKASSEQEKLSPDDYDRLLLDIHGIKIKDGEFYTPVSVGGVDFWISPDYEETKSEEDNQKSYKHKHIDSTMDIVDLDADSSISDEKFFALKDDIEKNMLSDTGMKGSLKSTADIKVADLNAIECVVMATNGIYRMTWINNTNEGKLLIVCIAYANNHDKKYDCDKDYKELIETARLSNTSNPTKEDASSNNDAKSKNDSASNNAASDNNSKSDKDNSSIKEFLDSYESFIDEYVDFLKKYNNSSNTMEMLSDYTDIMKRYAEFAEKVNKLDKDKMSPADAAYYLEVMARCTKKLAELY